MSQSNDSISIGAAAPADIIIISGKLANIANLPNGKVNLPPLESKEDLPQVLESEEAFTREITLYKGGIASVAPGSKHKIHMKEGSAVLLVKGALYNPKYIIPEDGCSLQPTQEGNLLICVPNTYDDIPE